MLGKQLHLSNFFTYETKHWNVFSTMNKIRSIKKFVRKIIVAVKLKLMLDAWTKILFLPIDFLPRDRCIPSTMIGVLLKPTCIPRLKLIKRPYRRQEQKKRKAIIRSSWKTGNRKLALSRQRSDKPRRAALGQFQLLLNLREAATTVH